MTSCLWKVFTDQNGVVTSVVTDDTVNANVGREDNLGLDVVKKGQIQSRPCAMGYSWKWMVYNPNRLLYPMKLVDQRDRVNIKE